MFQVRLAEVEARHAAAARAAFDFVAGERKALIQPEARADA